MNNYLIDALESLSDAIAIYDADDRLIFCNGAYIESFAGAGDIVVPGATLEDILRVAHDRDVFDIPGQDFDVWLTGRLERRRTAAGRPYIVRRAGRWVQSREIPTAAGGIVAVATDVTELREREVEFDTLRRRYALILNTVDQGIILLDCEGYVTFVNQMAAALLAVPAERTVGVSFTRLFLPDAGVDAPILAACRDGAIAEGKGQIFRTGRGDQFPVDYIIRATSEGDRVGGAVLVFRDATLRLNYEKTLADRRIRAITDSLAEGVLVVDGAGNVLFANPSALRMLACTEDAGAIAGRSVDRLFRLQTPQGPMLFAQSPWQTVVAASTTVRGDDDIFVLTSGANLEVAYVCTPLVDETRHCCIVVSFHAIGALKAAQREAMQASRLASVGQLAAGIAHEINTPTQYIGNNLGYLNAIVGRLLRCVEAGRKLADSTVGHDALAETLRHYEDVVKAARLERIITDLSGAVKESLDGVDRISRIVHSMKEFSHPGTTEKTQTNINEALENTLTVSRNVWKHVADVERHLDPALPMVTCHASAMNQVFLNLILNAVQAIEARTDLEAGRIVITTCAVGDSVEITLADNGGGVPQAIRDRIFDPFFTTKEVGKGTGQGLAICHTVVVTMHGGTIEVGGAEGEGAIFTVRIPIRGKDVDPEEIEDW